MKRFHSRFAAIQRLRKQQDTMASAMASSANAAAATALQNVKIAEQSLQQTYSATEAAMNEPVPACLLHVARTLAAVDSSNVSQKRQQLTEAKAVASQAATARLVTYQQLQIVTEAHSREFAEHRKSQLASQNVEILERFQQQSHSTNTERIKPTAELRKADPGAKQ